MATKEYSPDIIAQSFIKQYYDVLANKPHDLFRFYKEDSSFSFCEGPMPTDVVIGSRAINERVGQINFAGTRVDLSEGSIDAQKSGANCILIVVTGEFSLLGKAPRLFVQTFFLAGQGTSFYCCNSVLRLLPAPALVTPPAPVVVQPTPVVAATQPAPVPVAVAPQPVPTPVVSAPAPVPLVAAAATTAPHVIEQEQVQQNMQATVASLEEEEEEPEVAAPEEEEVVAAVVEEEEEPVDTGPKSYLDMLKRGTKAVAAPTTKAKAPAASSSATAKHTPATAAAHGTTDDKKTSATGGGESNGAAAKSKPAYVPAALKPALYISKLPLDATQDEVRGLFIKFGATAVKSVDIAVGKGFAFVDVESDAMLKTILTDVSSSLYTIKGAEVSVEEKKPPRSKITSGGTGGRGPHTGAGGSGGRSSGSGAPRRDNKGPSGSATGGAAASGGRGGGGGIRPARAGDKPASATAAPAAHTATA